MKKTADFSMNHGWSWALVVNIHFDIWIGNSVNLLKICVSRKKEWKQQKEKLGSENEC